MPVSARSPSGMFPILNAAGLRCPLIAYGGALILDERKEILFHRGMEKAIAEAIIGYLEKTGHDLSWCLYSLRPLDRQKPFGSENRRRRADRPRKGA